VRGGARRLARCLRLAPRAGERRSWAGSDQLPPEPGGLLAAAPAAPPSRGNHPQPASHPTPHCNHRHRPAEEKAKLDEEEAARKAEEEASAAAAQQAEQAQAEAAAAAAATGEALANEGRALSEEQPKAEGAEGAEDAQREVGRQGARGVGPTLGALLRARERPLHATPACCRHRR
jgi:hypothetical protein